MSQLRLKEGAPPGTLQRLTENGGGKILRKNFSNQQSINKWFYKEPLAFLSRSLQTDAEVTMH